LCTPDTGRVQISGNDVNRSKFYSGRNEEQIEVRECLLSFGAESVVFQVAIQKLKDQDI
jgi:hypothetical protein